MAPELKSTSACLHCSCTMAAPKQQPALKHLTGPFCSAVPVPLVLRLQSVVSWLVLLSVPMLWPLLWPREVLPPAP